MTDSVFVILVLISSIYQSYTAEVECNAGCPIAGNPYNLTCTSSTVDSCLWYDGTTKVMTCPKGGLCIPDETGYTGFRISDSNYVLQIDALSTLTLECRLGPDTPQSCSVSPLTDEPKGNLTASCDADVIECSGLTDHGNPAVTIELRNDTSVLASTSIDGTVYSNQSDSAGKTYTCVVTGIGSKCLSPNIKNVTCSALVSPQPVCEEKCVPALITLIIALLLLAVAFVLVIGCPKDVKKENVFIVCGIVLFVVGVVLTGITLGMCSCLSTALVISAACFSIICIIAGICLFIWGVHMCSRCCVKKKNSQ